MNHSEKRPNILFILADDMGCGDIGAFNFGVPQTPAIDRLVLEGTTLTQLYSASPVCAPARASLLTGRYPLRTGVADTQVYGALGLNETTVAEMLADGGYTTGIVGKWHLGWSDPRHRPAARGFQEAVALERTHHWEWIIDRNGQREESDGRYLADVLTEEALKFIRNHRDEPFFLYLAHFAPHAPLMAPEEDIQVFRDAGLSENVSKLYGMIRRMDRGIGEILDELRRLGLEENTVVIFASDNGPMFGSSWTDRTSITRYNFGFRGHKDLVYEGGIRVPGIIRWPKGLPKRQVIHDVIHFNDWTPTLLEMAGLDAPEEIEMDGVSVWPLLKRGQSQKSPWPRELYWQFSRYRPVPDHNAAIRVGEWKLVRPTEDDVTGPVLGVLEPGGLIPRPADLDPSVPYVPELPDPLPVQLFNLKEDPHELYDRSAEFPEIVAELSRKLDEWFDEVEADMQTAFEANQSGPSAAALPD